MPIRSNIVFLVYREGLNSVFLSQMAAPARLLAERGFPVRVWAFASIGEFVRAAHVGLWRAVHAAAGVTITRLPSPPGRARGVWNESGVLSWYLRHRSDPHHLPTLHCAGTFAAAIAVAAKEKFPGLRIVFHMYGLTHEEFVYGSGAERPGDLPPASRDLYEKNLQEMRTCSQEADAVVCVSEAMSRYAVAELGADASRTAVVPCCVDAAAFASARAGRDDLRRRHALGDRLVVTYCGSHYAWQAPRKTAETFLLIKSLEPRAHFLVLTTNPDSFRASLRDAGVRDADLTLLSVPHTEVPRYLAAADVALLLREPSIVNATASPVKFGEYLAAGLPVVISEQVGDYSDAVAREKIGVVLPHRADEQTTRRLLAELIESRRRDAAAVRRRCVDFAEKHLSWEAYLPLLARIHESLPPRTPAAEPTADGSAHHPLKSMIRFLGTYGVGATLEHALFRATELWYERRLGIRSSAVVALPDVGITDKRLCECRPTQHLTIQRILRALSIRPGKDVLLDIGVGMGRMMVMAATRPFRRVIGVELVPEFVEKAKDNLRRASRHLRCRDVEVVTCDATAFPIPPDVTVFFLNNPFSGEVLERMFERIRKSLQDNPRPHTIVSVRPPDQGEGWIGEQPWLRRTRTLAGLKGARVYFYKALDPSAPSSVPPRHDRLQPAVRRDRAARAHGPGRP